MVKNTAELRVELLSVIADVRSGKMDFKRAGAVSSIAGKILYSAKLELDFAKQMLNTGGKKRQKLNVVPFNLTNGSAKK